MTDARGWTLVGAGWVAVGLVTGLQIHLSSRLGPSPFPLDEALRVQLAHALPWIPATFVALTLGERLPVTSSGPSRPVLLHLGVAAAAAMVLNVLMVGSRALLAPPAVPPGGFWRSVASGVLEQGHLAVLAWGALVAAGHLRRRRSPGGRAVPGAPTPLTFQDHRGTVRVAPDELRWVEAEGDYVRLHTDDGDHLVTARMTELERRLSPLGFARVHRSAIVGLRRIRAHFPKSHGDRWIELDDGTRIVLTRGRRESVLARLEG